MLQLTKVTAKITAVTPHAEKHGQDNVPACSIRFMAAVPAQVLDGLDKDLRKIFWRKPAKDESQQAELNGMESNDGHTKLRHAKLAPQQWDEKFPGYTITLGSGLTSTTTETVIDDATVSKIKFEPKDGGHAVLWFSANFQVDAELFGDVAMMLQESVELSLNHKALPQSEIA